MKLGVANEGRPVPSGLGWMVCSASHRRRREGRHPSPDGIRCPSLGQAADRHSCAQHYNISQNQLWAAGRCCRVPGKYLFWLVWMHWFPAICFRNPKLWYGDLRQSQRIDVKEGRIAWRISRRAWCTAACHHALLVSHIGAQGDRVLSPRRWH